jgi:outer membrane protein OmpA-like peptidoglycan-associated protein
MTRSTAWGAGRTGVLAMAIALALGVPVALAESYTTRGVIGARAGNNITVTFADGTTTDMVLMPDTKVVQVSGKLGQQQSERTLDDVVIGLPVTVDATRNGDEIDVDRISFKSADLKTVRGGGVPVLAQAAPKAAEQQAQNDEPKPRPPDLGQYEEKASTSVLFPVGSAVITAQGKADLHAIAAEAKVTKGYVISVTGHADAAGDAVANQKLSARRAAVVTDFLQKFCDVAPERVLAAEAVGDAQGDADSEDAKAQNRRVVVRVLTGKGLAGL